MLFCAPFYQMYNVVHSFNKHKYLLKVQQPSCIFKGTNDITLRHIKQTCCLHRDTHAYHVCYALEGKKLRMLDSNEFGKTKYTIHDTPTT